MIKDDSIYKILNEIRRNLYDELNSKATQLIRIRNNHRVLMDAIYDVNFTLKEKLIE